jgi:CHAT domain-containing protein
VLGVVTSVTLTAALLPSAPVLAQTTPAASTKTSTAPDPERIKALVAAIADAKTDAERDCALARDPQTAASREFCRAAIAAGKTAWQSDRYDEAFALNAIARRNAQARGDKAAEADTLNNDGGVWLYKGNHAEAEKHFAQALALREAVGVPEPIGQSLTNLGYIQSASGRLTEARINYEKARAVFVSAAVPPARTATLDLNLGSLYSELGDQRAALAAQEKALAEFRAADDISGVSNAYSNMGASYYYLGDYGRALENFQRAVDVLPDRPDMRRPLSKALGNAAAVHGELGNYDLAFDFLRRALASDESVGDKRSVAGRWLTMGQLEVKHGQGYEAEAERLLRKAQEIDETVEGHPLKAEIAIALAVLYLHQERTGEASRYADEAYKLTAGGEPIYFSEALGAQSQVALLKGDAGTAAEKARELIALARKIESSAQLWYADLLLARALRAQGDAEGARTSLEDAIRLIEGVREGLGGSDADRQRFFETAVGPYYELADLLVSQNRPEEALRMAERAKGRALLDVLTSGRTTITKAMTVAERAKENALSAALTEANIRRQRAQAEDRPAADAALTKARRAYESFQATLYAAHPVLRVQRSGPTRPLNATELAAFLPDDRTAMLEYVVADKKSYLFVLTRAPRPTKPGQSPVNVAAYPLKGGRQELTQAVHAFREALAGRDARFSDTARTLYNRLLRPAAKSLAGRTNLVLVPDGPLWELPFQVLQPAAGRYVLDQATLSYAPSLSVLREMRSAAAGRARRGGAEVTAAGARTLLAVGNASPGTRDSGALAGLVRGGGGSRDGANGFAPLPEAEAEVKALARLYGESKTRVLVKADANETRVKREAARSRVLHFATHAVLSDASPLYSYIVLAPGAAGKASAKGDPASDGLLEARELLDMGLSADLAVLSACETGLGKVGQGEGVIGLSWALFVAGCPSAVVSQWQVDSAATEALMVGFHKELVTGGAGKAEALRRAALSVRARPGFAHPFYWAGFVLVGEGASPLATLPPSTAAAVRAAGAAVTR